MAIWAWLFGFEHFGEPANHVWPIVLGMGVHMMNSAIVGIGFVAFMRVLRPTAMMVAVPVGVAYALTIWIVNRYVVAPINDGEAVLFTTDLVSPEWVWWLAHAALGMTAAVFYHYAARRKARRVGRRQAQSPQGRDGVTSRVDRDTVFGAGETNVRDLARRR